MTSFPLGRTRGVRSAGALCAGLALAATGLVGCSGEGDPDAGTNGVGKLSAGQIESRTLAAAKAAPTVRLSGTVVVKGHTYRLDMRLKENGGTGEVTSKGATFGLLRVGDQLFLKADAGFWTRQDGKGGGAHAGSGTAGDKLDGMYVRVPQGDPSYRQLSGFTDKSMLLGGLLTLHGTLAKGDRGDSGGVRTVRLTGDKGAGGTLDVSLEGTPYPVRLERAGHAGTVQLSDWGKDFALKEPPKNATVDYGKQLPTS
ncbi:hypothetical protein ACWCP6_36565 [Streptomyces sp. NPDC002004]